MIVRLPFSPTEGAAHAFPHPFSFRGPDFHAVAVEHVPTPVPARGEEVLLPTEVKQANGAALSL